MSLLLLNYQIETGYQSAEEDFASTKSSRKIKKVKKVKKSKGKRLDIYQQLLNLDLTKKEAQEDFAAEFLPRMVRLVQESRKINPNQVTNAKGQTIFHLAFQLNLPTEVLLLMRRPDFQPLDTWFEAVKNGIKATKSDEVKHQWRIIREAILRAGLPIPTNINLYGNIRGASISFSNKYDTNQNHFGHALSNAGMCISCLDTIKEGEPYFFGMAGCNCRIHLECCITMIKSIYENLYDPNPLNRKVPVCPSCKLMIRPSFFSVFQKILNSLTFWSTDLQYLISIKETLKTHRDFLEKFSKLETPCSTLHQQIYPILFRNHPRRVNCTQTPECPGFYVMNYGETQSRSCMVCQKWQIFRGIPYAVMSKKEKNEVQELLKNNNFQPCSNCFHVIEKRGGCEHVYCKHCNTEFTWQKFKTNIPKSLMDKAVFF